MLTYYWLLTGAAFLMAGLALVKARRAAKRLERLTESYWELRYDQGQLRSRLAKIDPDPPPPGEPVNPRQTGTTAFVPLSSLKR